MSKTAQIIKQWKSSEIKIKKDSKGMLWVVLGKEKVKLPTDLKVKDITLSQAEGFLGLDKAIDDLVDEIEQERKEKSKAPWMIGNKFWQQRSKHGRDKLFSTPELLWEAACEYFQWCDDNPWMKREAIKSGDRAGVIISIPTERPYTLQGLTSYLHTNKGYFDDFEKSLKDKTDEISKDFSVIVTRIREIIYQQKFEGAAIGAFNANIIARDLGLTDKKDHTSNGETIQTPARVLTKAEVKDLLQNLDNEY